MPIFARCRCYRPVAAIVLAGWLLALFVSIVHGCISGVEVSDQQDHAHAAMPGYADAGSDHAQLDQLCEIACDTQASSMISEKSFEPPNTDRLLLIASAYGPPLPSVTNFKPDFPRNPILPFEYRVFLRTSRLTL